MLKSTSCHLALPLLVAATLLAVHCAENGNEWGPAAAARGGGDGRADGWFDEPGQVYEMPPACDPDGQAPCPGDRFVCITEHDGGKQCEGQMPAIPDSGSWACEIMGTTMICRGDHVPSDAGHWLCDQRAPGDVICRQHAYVPAGGEGGYWDCAYVDEFLSCHWTEGERPGDEDVEVDDRPPGAREECPEGVDEPSEEVCGDGVDNDCDGWTDEFCSRDDFDPFDDVPEGDPHDPWEDGPGETDGEPPDGCTCVPGARRYCDTPTYCQWGVQSCAATGMRWRACRETSPPAECRGVASWYSPEAEECCIRSGHCCQDMWDLDMDGDTWESLGACTDISCG